jgi:serine/threonine protein kinase
MLTGRPPFGDVEALRVFMLIVTSPHPKYTLPTSCTDDTKKILKETFKKNARDRPSAEQLLCQFFTTRPASG